MNTIMAALLNGALMSIPLTVAVWVALRLTPRGALNSATRYVVWWATLAVVVTLPAMYLPIHSWSWLGRAPSQVVAGRDGVGVSQTTAWQVSESSVVSIAAPRSRRLFFPFEVAAGRWPQWIAATWLLVTLLLLVRLMAACLLLERRKARAVAAPDQLAARVEDWLTQCGCKRSGVRLACSTEIATPLAAGLRRPAILIPTRLLAELGPDELDQIGLHETAHLARGDDYALVFQRVLEALFALHPVVRWITRRMDLEREIACDDFVVQATRRPRPYAACLTRVVELAGGVRVSLAGAGAADERSHLTRRVEMLLDKTRHTGTRLLKVRLTAVFVALAALLWLAAKTPGLVAFAAPVPQPPPQTPPAVQLPRRAPSPTTAPPVNRHVEPVIVQTQVKGQIHVSVTDPLHRFVTGLERDHFKLFENGDEQEISQFSGAGSPTSIGIIFDVGDTAGGKIEKALQAVQQFVKTKNAEDEFFLVQIDGRPRLAAGFTSHPEEFQNSLMPAQSSGPAALADGLAMALNEMKRARNSRKAILILADAGMGLSSALPNTDVQIHAIGILEPADSPDSLKGIAAQTGGEYFAVDNLADLPSLTAKVGIEIRNQYVLGYTPKNLAPAGEFRTVRVDLAPPRGLPPLQANSRRGYFAPAAR
jgi:Ca-activated chloride channel family protein